MPRMQKTTATIATTDGPQTVPAWNPRVPGLVVTRIGKTLTVTHGKSGLRLSGTVRLRTLDQARRWARAAGTLADWTRPAADLAGDAMLGIALGTIPSDAPEDWAPSPIATAAQPADDDDAPACDGRFEWDGEVLETPTVGMVRAWMFDSVVEALDGCCVEPDGRCPHGAPSWLLALGVV